LHADGSCEVADDGRGMPVDIHPEEKIPGVELILTKLHAGGKFSNKNYTFSGGLHGVGVSVVNALSKQVRVHQARRQRIPHVLRRRRQGQSKLDVVGTVGKKNTGTRVRFWPDPKYFDTPKFNLRALKHLLRAKAVLCPGLAGEPVRRGQRRTHRLVLRRRLRDYLRGGSTPFLRAREILPPELFVGNKERHVVDWAWPGLPEGDRSRKATST
jgi:topoisomerase-4 subunit B